MPSDDQPSAVNLNAQDVTVGGDVAGRDINKQITNIFLLSEFLGYAEVASLLGQPAEPPRLASAEEAIQTLIQDRHSRPMAEALAFAGDILGPPLRRWRETTPTPALPIKDLLNELPTEIAARLVASGHWGAVKEKARRGKAIYEVLWLYSQQALFAKRGQAVSLHGIAFLPGQLHSLRVPAGFQARFVRLTTSRPGSLPRCEAFDVSLLKPPQVRVFMAGLVLDLVRVFATAAGDAGFLEGLIELLTRRAKTG